MTLNCFVFAEGPVHEAGLYKRQRREAGTARVTVGHDRQMSSANYLLSRSSRALVYDIERSTYFTSIDIHTVHLVHSEHNGRHTILSQP